MTGSVEFFNPNEITYESTFEFTTAPEANAAFLYDNDLRITLSSDGSADGVNEKFKITFDSAKQINFVGIFNHNIKNGNIKYLDVSLAEQAFSPAITYSNNSTENDAFVVTEQTCYGIVINCTETQDAGEKYIGELRALYKFAELTRPYDFKPTPLFASSLKNKVDGGVDRVINGIKFGGTFEFQLLDSEVDTYMQLFERGRYFFIYQASLSSDKVKQYFRVQDQYPVNVANSPTLKLPSSLVDDVSWTGSLQVKEI
ncbi:hypothetical protein [Polynucleobacter sp.]|uniref:hypothetical protein n=1 Tax=Polynucleobacter sp. TaxID=2029855 RepID=UPI003F69B607